MPAYPEPLFQQITHQEKKAFLAAFAHCGRIRRACTAAQISWKSHYLWLKNDPLYAEAFDEAKRIAGDFLEDEAIRRAIEGVQKPIFYQGQHVDNETVYSDTLLIFTLKAAKPNEYRDTSHLEVSGNITFSIEEKTREANARIERLRRVSGLIAS